MGTKANLGVILYRGVLRVAKQADRDSTPEADRQVWRERVRALMLRQIQRHTGLVDDDGSLEGYVSACEGHNWSVTRDLHRYAILNVKDAADRIKRQLGEAAAMDQWLIEDDDADETEAVLDEPAPAEPVRVEEEPPARARVLEMPPRPTPDNRWKPSLADKIGNTKWAR